MSKLCGNVWIEIGSPPPNLPLVNPPFFWKISSTHNRSVKCAICLSEHCSLANTTLFIFIVRCFMVRFWLCALTRSPSSALTLACRLAYCLSPTHSAYKELWWAGLLRYFTHFSNQAPSPAIMTDHISVPTQPQTPTHPETSVES